MVVIIKGERYGVEEVLILMGWIRWMKMLEYGMEVLLYCKMLEVGMRYVICLEVVLILVDCVLYIKLFVMLF